MGICGGERGLGGAVPRGLVGRAWSGWRSAVVIGGESVVWVALCSGDWRGERGLGGAVPWGLVGIAWSGWRCAVGIGGGAWSRCRCAVVIAVPWGLAGRAWSGWRCAVVIGGESVVWVGLCHGVRWGERGLGGAVPW